MIAQCKDLFEIFIAHSHLSRAAISYLVHFVEYCFIDEDQLLIVSAAFVDFFEFFEKREDNDIIVIIIVVHLYNAVIQGKSFFFGQVTFKESANITENLFILGRNLSKLACTFRKLLDPFLLREFVE